MPKATKGDAILRIALAGADGGNGTAPSVAGNLTIGVNGKEVGTLHPVATNALRYNTDKGVWNQYVQKFDASLLKPGENSVTFTVPAGDVTTGVVRDYLGLELNDGSKAYPTAPDSGRPDAPAVPPITTASRRPEARKVPKPYVISQSHSPQVHWEYHVHGCGIAGCARPGLSSIRRSPVRERAI
jgi:hypothetical protein